MLVLMCPCYAEGEQPQLAKGSGVRVWAVDPSARPAQFTLFGPIQCDASRTSVWISSGGLGTRTPDITYASTDYGGSDGDCAMY